MSALICGSLAYDTIMVFPDQFKEHILPDKVHMLNVSFLVPKMRREFGGVAGNIAYSLKLLGEDPWAAGDRDPHRAESDVLRCCRRRGKTPGGSPGTHRHTTGNGHETTYRQWRVYRDCIAVGRSAR